MKKALAFTLILMMMAPFAWAKGGSTRERVPKVRYIEPSSEAVVDLTGKKSLLFRWKAPTPAGGRQMFRFNLWKGYGYEVLVGKELDPKVYSIEVPADILENGQVYTWQVKQRDLGGHTWSMDYRWGFTVKK